MTSQDLETEITGMYLTLCDVNIPICEFKDSLFPKVNFLLFFYFIQYCVKVLDHV